ncbi:MAG TPA: hypothetical protein VH186_06685 [Chloroflexia bacterium]|nr:hypothetical protein [Chloroflexia bacterium]
MQRSPINGADSTSAFSALERAEVLSSGFSRFRCHSPAPSGPVARKLDSDLTITPLSPPGARCLAPFLIMKGSQITGLLQNAPG